MAYITNCSICETQTCDNDMCPDCKDTIASRASSGKPWTKEEVAQISRENRFRAEEHQAINRLRQVELMKNAKPEESDFFR